MWKATTEPGSDWPGTTKLLDAVEELTRATADEMASFISTWGVLHGSAGPGSAGVDELRRYARGIGAARRVGAALVTRLPGARADWLSLQLVLSESWAPPEDPDDWNDWKLGRERFARWVSRLFAETGVTARADWVGLRGLAIEPGAESLAGLIAILLAREVGAEGMYECSSCGAPVARNRPPRPGESVYCARAECRREQRRRNQAKWRAKKALGKG